MVKMPSTYLKSSTELEPILSSKYNPNNNNNVNTPSSSSLSTTTTASNKLKPVKDLPGTIVDRVMLRIATDQTIDNQQAKIFGRFISQFVTKYISEGVEDESILVLGFDLDQWNQRKRLNQRGGDNTSSSNSKVLDDQTKQSIVNKLLEKIHIELREWYSIQDIQGIF